MAPPKIFLDTYMYVRDFYKFTWMRPFLARNAGFRLFLVLETLEQPKISCLKPKFLQAAQHDFRATSVCKIFEVTHKKTSVTLQL